MKNFPTSLFEQLPAHCGESTSVEAARKIKRHSGRLHQLILAHLRNVGRAGATDDELEVALGLRHQTVSPRRRELDLAGVIMKNGKMRPTRSGRLAKVWVTTEARS